MRNVMRIKYDKKSSFQLQPTGGFSIIHFYKRVGSGLQAVSLNFPAIDWSGLRKRAFWGGLGLLGYRKTLHSGSPPKFSNGNRPLIYIITSEEASLFRPKGTEYFARQVCRSSYSHVVSKC